MGCAFFKAQSLKEMASFCSPGLLFLPPPTRSPVIIRREILISFHLCLPNCAEILPTSSDTQRNSRSCCSHSLHRYFFHLLPCTCAPHGPPHAPTPSLLRSCNTDVPRISPWQGQSLHAKPEVVTAWLLEMKHLPGKHAIRGAMLWEQV